MRYVFWLIPGILAGRPGPDLETWDLAELRRAGIGAILSVNDGALCHPEEFARNDIHYRCLPLSPNAPPRPGDMEHCRQVLPRALDFVDKMQDLGRATLVHCHSGKDRTGLFMVYYLVRTHGLSSEAALATLKKVRPIALSADGWEQFANEVLAGT